MTLFNEQHTGIIKDEFENGKTDPQIATVIFNKTGLSVTGQQVKKKRQIMRERGMTDLKRAQGAGQQLLFTDEDIAVIKVEFENGKTDPQIAKEIKAKTGLSVTGQQVQSKRQNMDLMRAHGGSQCKFTPQQDGHISSGFSMGMSDKENAKNVNAKTGSSFDARQIEGRRNTKGWWKRTNTKLDAAQLLETGKLINAAKVDGTSIAKSHAIIIGTAAGLSSEATGAEICYNTAKKYTAMARNGDAIPAAKEPSMTNVAIRYREKRGKLKRRAEEAANDKRAAENLAGLKSCGDEEVF